MSKIVQVSTHLGGLRWQQLRVLCFPCLVCVCVEAQTDKTGSEPTRSKREGGGPTTTRLPRAMIPDGPWGERIPKPEGVGYNRNSAEGPCPSTPCAPSNAMGCSRFPWRRRSAAHRTASRKESRAAWGARGPTRAAKRTRKTMQPSWGEGLNHIARGITLAAQWTTTRQANK